jgi:hypothetical protein
MEKPPASRLRTLMRAAWAPAVALLRFHLRLAVTIVRGTVEVLLALILLFEEWGWRPLADLLARLARWPAWTRIESGIAALPPYAALVAFAMPSVLLLPLKFAALYLIAKGQAVAATMLFAFAKVAGTALVARLFQLTQPALMRIAWFAALYRAFVPWQEALFARIRESWAWRYGRVLKVRVRKQAQAAWTHLKPRLAAIMEEVRKRARSLLGPAGS